MKFMTLVHETHRPTDEPPMELFAAIGALQAKSTADGTFVQAGGLAPMAAAGAIVSLTGGSIGTTDGPFVEVKELVGGYAVYDVADTETAVEKARSFLQAHLDSWPGWEGWVEVRAIFEPPA
ncbi:YciI family protein [Aeromicrobium sp. HA]|uniref:YciI family protein n=1 Tax=unclassified Aeromicrobium TaxID=2633570 RepID=UPI0022AFB7AB|nr:YciI family protein [Aeromicrobium sp. HA]